MTTLQSVSVAQALGRVHDLPHSNVRHNPAKGQHIVEVDLTATLLAEVVGHATVLDSPRGQVLLLPQPPESVDLRVVKEEERSELRDKG